MKLKPSFIAAGALGGILCAALWFRSLDPWRIHLHVLNQDPQGQTSGLFSARLDEDLLVTYQGELESIQSKWNGHPNQGQREARNRFFHQSVVELNTKGLAGLRRARGTVSRADQVKDVLAAAEKNPVAQLSRVQSFSQGGHIGFCFGRALLIHQLLLQSGVPQREIVKVFALGRLRVGGVFWRFHVAVVVLDKDGPIVLDPLQARPLPLEEWVGVAAGYGIKAPVHRTRFYVTDPRKFLPAFGAYHRDQLTNPVLKPYFDQLLETLASS